MKNDLQTLLCKILGETQYSKRTEKLLTCLNENGVKNVDDLEYVDKNWLVNLGILSNNEIDTIMNKIMRMTLEDALEDIFKESDRKERVHVVYECLRNCGAERAEDLKYFDWESLKSANILSEMEVEKIMYFVKKYFPKEHKEHKAKKTEADRLAREIDLIKQKNESEILLDTMRNKAPSIDFLRRNINVPGEVNGAPSDEPTEAFRNIRHEDHDFTQLLTSLIQCLQMFWLMCSRFAEPLAQALTAIVFLLIGFILSIYREIIVPILIRLERTILGT